MADDQVKYSDLIVDDGAIDALDKRLDDIKKKMAEVKGEAAVLTAETRNLSTATREQQQATSQNAAAAENLRQRMKGLTEEQKRLEAERRKYAKLTEEEANRVKTMSGVYQQYAQAVRNGTDAQMKSLPTVDMQNKSYNELYQTYNALKDALNKMTVAERENTAAGKSMVNQAKEIRDTLNNLQQQTGNYTLNVGNYMSAMNGLQMQTQQILREIPSAQNLSQFFLAISNNIPMFTDALARYNKGLPEIKAKLAAVTAEITRQTAAMAAMNAQSTEYAAAQERLNELQRKQQQLQGASVKGWRAILKAVGSWQTLLIAGLLILRKIPEWVETIVDVVKTLNGEIWKATRYVVSLTDVQMQTIEATKEEEVRLNILLDALDQATRGSQRFVDITKEIGEIIGKNIDPISTTAEAVRDLAEAYLEQAKNMAKAKVVEDIITTSRLNKIKREKGMAALEEGDFEKAAIIMGWSGSDYDKNKKLYEKAQGSFGPGWDAVSSLLFVSKAHPFRIFSSIKASSDISKLITSSTPYMSDEDEQRLIEEEWDFFSDLIDKNNNNNGPKNEKPTEQSTKDRYWEAERALLEARKEGYDLERELAKLNRDKRYAELQDWYKGEREALKENLDNGFLTQEEYENKVKELNRQAIAIRVGIRNDYDNAIEASIQKELEEEKKAAKEAERLAKEKIAQEEKDFKAHQEIDKRRFELTKHTAKEERKFVMQQQMEFLQWRIDHAAALGISPELLEVMKKEYAQMQEMFNKGIYSTGKKNSYSSGMEVIADVLGFDIDKEQINALNSVFDQAKEALNSWMDARKAAADQAKELADDEVSAAENALNREIELRNQGYANDVALREKELADAKAAQKKAVEEQKKIAQEQILLDAALQTSSLITASANILKQFAAQPLLAASLLGLMWGSFGYAKIKAYQASTKSIQFKEGGVMLLEGGSHESGHDVNLGIGPDGSNLRAEGGEYFAVINKRSSRKYGSQIPAVVNALNSGMFEDSYIKTSDAVGMMGNVGLMGNVGEAVDLSSLEGGVDALVKQGESRWSVEGGYRVLRYKNLTRRVKIG